MTLAKLNAAFDTRLQVASKAYTVEDLTASATSQVLPFAAALPAQAIVASTWYKVTAPFASVGTATKATKTGEEVETFALTHGWTTLLNVDTLGEETATFEFTAGSQGCNTYFPVADLVGLTLNVSTNGGTDELVTFTSPCTTSAHVIEQIAAQTTGLAGSSVATAVAAFIPTNTVDATFELIVNGDTAVIDVDDDGADTATWGIGRAISAGSGLSISDLTGLDLELTLDEGGAQVITFAGTESTVALVAAKINADLFFGSAVVNGTEVDILSDTYGNDSRVNVTGGTALGEIGQSIADNTRASDDAANGRLVTIAEIKTFLEADITAGSGLTIADIGSNRFSITSNTTGTNSELDIQSGALLAKLGITVDIVVGTADQPLLTSDKLGTISTIAVVDVDSGLTWAAATPGAGDAVDSTVVTAAEVVAVFDADFTNGSVHEVTAGAVSITTSLAGIGGSLNFGAGTANSALGYTDETITGVDAVNGTCVADMGVSGGDVNALIDGGSLAAIAKVNGPKGVASDGHYGGEILAVKFISNINVALLTTGALTAYAAYSDQVGVIE